MISLLIKRKNVNKKNPSKKMLYSGSQDYAVIHLIMV